MAYPEYRGKDRHGRDRWRVKWPDPARPGKELQASRDEFGNYFFTREDAQNYGDAQEADIRRGQFKDPRAAEIKFLEWATSWYEDLELEDSTLENYLRMLKDHIMATFGHLALVVITPKLINQWERSIVKAGYAPSTAATARAVLSSCLDDAVRDESIPITVNPAAKPRGKGRKSTKRVQRFEHAEKVWCTPPQVVLIAERVALLSGRWADFVLILLAFYSGARWSELLALTPKMVEEPGVIKLRRKLYENGAGRFYWGPPKDGSMRDITVPMWLWDMVAAVAAEARTCTCAEARKKDDPAHYCKGTAVLFLGDRQHHRRSAFRSQYLRPAADGAFEGPVSEWPERVEQREPIGRRVLADASRNWPGVPLESWPAPVPGQPYTPPVLRHIARQTKKAVGSRSSAAELRAYAVAQGADPAFVAKATREALLDAYVRPSRNAVVSWMALCEGLTMHGLRHGRQTSMDNGRIAMALKLLIMGHTDATISARYGHVTPEMTAELLALDTRLWRESLRRRLEMSPRSSVVILDAALQALAEELAEEADGEAAEGIVTPLISQKPPKTSRARLSG
ncbi:hypothetical protein AB0I81_39875 [Nonomuraea sp. NPDC050404]|uniref:tyrosine-type recombinase/integrase n=1 Tax=Nonomuraea sp. NPDC050404 TaxID=3155783 RepID=UPI00340799F1